MKVKFLSKLLLISFLFLVFFVGKASFSHADPICSSIDDCQQKKAEKENQLKTIASQINQINIDIQLNQYRIENVKQQIQDLTLDIDTTTKKITNIEKSLDDLTKVLINRVIATYEIGSSQSFQMLIASNNVQDFVKRANYLRIAQAHDKRLIYDTVQAKNDYANQKDIFEGKKQKIEDLKAQLEVYNNQLAQDKVLQQQLQSTTQAQLDAINAQISALSAFAHARVGGSGSGIIPHQDISDGWGRYYNQRDANWGNNYIGSSSEQIWEVGCLLTSYAMVSTHFGSGITPADVAANSGNFAAGTAYFRIGLSANGHGEQYTTNPSLDTLRDALNSGAVIIAGLSNDGGPYPSHYSDHWVVLRSVDGGSFRINDPWYSGAMNVSFNDHYSGWTIIEARIYR